MEKELIKRYLRKKINPKVIAIELGVTTEMVEECKQELLLEEERRKKEKMEIELSDSKSYLKMQVLRDKYKKMYYLGNTTSGLDNNSIKMLSAERLEEVETIIRTIEEEVSQLDNKSNTDIRKIAFSVSQEAKKLKEVEVLPIELAQRLEKAMSKITLFKISKEDRVYSTMEHTKKMASQRLVQSVDFYMEQLDDIDELKRIKEILPREMGRNSQLLVTTVKNKIQRKIESLQKKRVMENFRKLPENISKIAEDLVNDDLDIPEAIKIIEDEAKLRVASRPQNRFSVTTEQEKRQIGIQIKNAIAENPNTYKLKNPITAVEYIQKLCGGEIGTALSAIVKNLIGRKHFETAKIICKKFSQQSQDETLKIYIRRLQEEIKNAEIGDMVLRGINMIGTPNEQGLYYEMIQMRLKREGVNPKAVPLGKNEDGSKNIILADIWPSEAKSKKGISR